MVWSLLNFRSNNFFHTSTRTLFWLSLSAELRGCWPNIPWRNGIRIHLSDISYLSNYAALLLFKLISTVEFSFMLKYKLDPDGSSFNCLTSNSSYWKNWRQNKEKIETNHTYNYCLFPLYIAIQTLPRVSHIRKPKMFDYFNWCATIIKCLW